MNNNLPAAAVIRPPCEARRSGTKTILWSVAIIVIYCAGYTWNLGFTLADVNYHGAFGETKYMCANYKRSLVFAALWSILPITWIEEPFLQMDLYSHGWRIHQLPECDGLPSTQGERLRPAAGNAVNTTEGK